MYRANNQMARTMLFCLIAVCLLCTIAPCALISHARADSSAERLDGSQTGDPLSSIDKEPGDSSTSDTENRGNSSNGNQPSGSTVNDPPDPFFTQPVNAPFTPIVRKIFKEFAQHERLNACKYPIEDLRLALTQLPPDIDEFAPDFRPAIKAAISARKNGACSKKNRRSGIIRSRSSKLFGSKQRGRKTGRGSLHSSRAQSREHAALLKKLKELGLPQTKPLRGRGSASSSSSPTIPFSPLPGSNSKRRPAPPLLPDDPASEPAPLGPEDDAELIDPENEYPETDSSGIIPPLGSGGTQPPAGSPGLPDEVISPPSTAVPPAAVANVSTKGIPTAVIVLSGLAGLMAVGGLGFLGFARTSSRERMASYWHTWSEATYRASGVWFAFRDWVRIGR